jgi:hypothetical protein
VGFIPFTVGCAADMIAKNPAQNIAENRFAEQRDIILLRGPFDSDAFALHTAMTK